MIWWKRWVDALFLFSGGMVSLGLVAFVHQHLYGASGVPLLVAAFGASAVVLFACDDYAVARPRNVFGGSLLSALIGVIVAMLMHDQAVWMAGALAVSLSLAAMHITDTMHPPGGAMALIAVAGSPAIHQLGFMYVVYPIGTGVLCMFVVARLINRFR